MSTFKLKALGAFVATAAASASTSVFAAATAAGDEFDGMVEAQNVVQGIIDNGGAFTIILISVIVAVIAFSFKRDWTALAIPIVVGVFLSVGVDFASGLGGYSAGTDLYTSEVTQPLAATVG